MDTIFEILAAILELSPEHLVGIIALAAIFVVGFAIHVVFEIWKGAKTK